MNNYVGKTYTFESVAFPGMMLNFYYSQKKGENVVLWGDDGSPEQQWKVIETSDYCYKLQTMKDTARVLNRHVESGADNNNADAVTMNSNANATQEILIGSSLGNIVYISMLVFDDPNASTLYLTAVNNEEASGTAKTPTSDGNVYWAPAKGANGGLTSAQKWRMVEVGATSGDEEDETEGQRLIMPINQSRITVGYKSNAPAYHEQAIKNGFSDPVHYAVDMVGTPRSFYASGDGTVVGYSTTDAGSLGKWLAVRYNNVIDIHGNNIGDVVFRYCHLDDIYKTSGEVHVDDASPMARYGSTGTGASLPHLHMEVDTDVEHPNKTPSLSGSSNGLVGGKNNDTTIDPFEVFYRKTSIPENQTVTPSQSYCDIPNCSVCATQYSQYEDGKVPYVNEAQCNSVPILPE